jgi:hypothetical protein
MADTDAVSVRDRAARVAWTPGWQAARKRRGRQGRRLTGCKILTRNADGTTDGDAARIRWRG